MWIELCTVQRTIPYVERNGSKAEQYSRTNRQRRKHSWLISYHNGKIVLFADNAIIIMYDNTNKDNLKMKMQEDINTIYEWFSQNKLSMNIKKTKTIIITHTHLNRHFKLNLNIRNQEIDQVDNYTLYIFRDPNTERSQVGHPYKQYIKRKISAITQNHALRKIFYNNY